LKKDFRKKFFLRKTVDFGVGVQYNRGVGMRNVYISLRKGTIMTRSLIETTSPKAKSREKLNMTEQEARIRVEVRKSTTRPSNTIKTDIIIYAHGSGRINYWISREDSLNYDIVSYYFTYNKAEIKIFDENNCIKFIKL
jgi:hypothetical protein